MDYIKVKAERGDEKGVMRAFTKYNHRTCPLVGDVVDIAVQSGLLSFLKHLLDNMYEELEQKHMTTAVKTGQVKVIQFLVDRGLSVLGLVIDCVTWTPPSHLLPTLRILLQHGADETGKDSDGNTATTLTKKRKDVCAKSCREVQRTLKSVSNWREWKHFKEACTTFNRVSDRKSDRDSGMTRTTEKSLKKKSKSSQERENIVSKLNEDLLANVYSFMSFNDWND